jgi:hypothetical protein
MRQKAQRTLFGKAETDFLYGGGLRPFRTRLALPRRFFFFSLTAGPQHG